MIGNCEFYNANTSLIELTLYDTVVPTSLPITHISDISWMHLSISPVGNKDKFYQR